MTMRRNKPKKLGRDQLVEVVKNAPLVSIDLVVKNSRGQILVGLRKNAPAKGFWFVPGGRILKDERISEAFERIAYDELGIKPAFEDARFLGVFEHLYPNNFTEKEGFGTHYVVLAYEIKINETELSPPRNQHSEYKWLNKESLDEESNVHAYTRVYFDCHR
jgi:colanic acid biosynthesis protein WcaH